MAVISNASSALACWRLKRYTERYAQSASARKPLLLIPGWSCDAEIFDWIIPGLAQHFVIYSAEIVDLPESVEFDALVEDLYQAFYSQVTQPSAILGWSLGGNIALSLAHRSWQLNDGLIDSAVLLGSSPSFIQRDDFELGMPVATFNAFQAAVQKNTAKGLKRFDLLQVQGFTEKQALLKQSIADYRASRGEKAWSQESLIRGLDLLAEFDQRDIYAQLASAVDAPRIKALFAEGDALVNSSVVEHLKQHVQGANSRIEFSKIENAGHLFFLTDTDKVFDACLSMLPVSVSQSESFHLAAEKQKVAAAFSKAAVNYDQSADVQCTIAQQLLDNVSAYTHSLEQAKSLNIVDAGCGTGYWTERLLTISNDKKVSNVTGVDFAEGMLNFAKSHHTQVPHWLKADLESMPLLPGQTDIIFSSLAIQWCEDLTQLFSSWYELLAAGGSAFVATLGPETLLELSQSFAVVDDEPHVNEFAPVEALLSAAKQSGFSISLCQSSKEIIEYDHALGLMKDLKNIGAQTVIGQSEQAKRPMTKEKLKTLAKAYENFRDPISGLLPATYDVIYLHLQK